MLAAWNRKDQPRVPADRIVQRVIRRRIAGVKRDHHIYRIRALISVDVPQFKAQILIAVLFCRLVAVLDHIRLQVQTDDPHIQLPDLRQIIVQNKCQIRFAASKIDHRQCPVFGKRPDLVVDQLHKTVDLTVFIIHGPDDLSFRCEDSHIHQGRNRLSLFQNIVFLPVMARLLLRSLRRLLFHIGCFSALGDTDRMFPFSVPGIQLAVFLPHGPFQKQFQRLFGHIFVKNLFFRIFFRLPACFQTIDHDPPELLILAARIAQDHFIRLRGQDRLQHLL